MSPANPEKPVNDSVDDEANVVVHDDGDSDILISSQIWSRAEEGILKESIKIYRKTPYREKGLFIMKKVVRRIKKLDIKAFGAAAYEKGGEKFEDWKLKKARIYTYMMNHGRVERGVKLPGMNRKWTFISVLRELHRADILEEAKRLSGGDDAKKGAWLGYYQQARMNVQAALTGHQKRAIEELVIKWNQGDIPPAVQQRNAKANANKTIREIAHRTFVNMGMRCLIIECHMDLDGKMVVSFNDTVSLKVDDPNMPSFKEQNPTAMADLVTAYKRYAKKVHQVLTTGSDTATPGEILNHVGLLYHPRGLPKVPAEIRNDRGVETCRVQQGIIRTYLNRHYELASGKAVVPYGKIVTLLSQGVMVFAAEHWPPGVEFKEPGGYRTGATNAILRFWRRREEQGLLPFRFCSIVEGTGTAPANYPDDIFELEPPPPRVIDGPQRLRKRPTMRNRDLSDSDSEDVKSDSDPMEDNTEDEEEDESMPPDSQEPSPSIDGVPPQKRILPGQVRHRAGVGKGQSEEVTTDSGGSGSDESDPDSVLNDLRPNATRSEGSPTLPPESERGCSETPIGGGGSDDQPDDLRPARPKASKALGSKTGNTHSRRTGEKRKPQGPAVAPRQTRAQVAKDAPPTQGTRSKAKAKK